MITLSNNVHIFARPILREKLISFFATILGCEPLVSSDAPNLPVPVIAFRFPNGGSLSIEFTDEALDEKQARRGAWLEVKVDNPSELKKKISEVGGSEVKYFGNDHFYFAAPGGQVLRLVSAGQS
jgi:hypothetical protein